MSDKQFATDAVSWAVLYQPVGSYVRCVFRNPSQDLCDAQANKLFDEAFAGDSVWIVPAVYADGTTHPQYLQAIANHETTDLH